jgi:hypothetical protein
MSKILYVSSIYFLFSMCACNIDTTRKSTIPEGAYKLLKTNDKGFNKVTHLLNQSNAYVNGLGSTLNIIGDTVYSTDPISEVIKNLRGSMNKFIIMKSNTENQYFLNMPGSNPLPLELTSQKNLTIILNSGDSLIYIKEYQIPINKIC